ncbi:MAG: arginine--tRNA ligase [Candidatus Hodarchaeota archaeon]
MDNSKAIDDLIDPISTIQDEIQTHLKKSLKSLKLHEIPIHFEIPPDPKFGDFSTPVCMGLAKQLKQNPREIAGNLKERLNIEDLRYISKVEIAGPGYLNFYLDWDKAITLIHDSIASKGNKYGYLDIGKNKKVIVEHTSVNPNKPIHLGNARCAILGDLTGRLLRIAGYDVEIDNYVDDLGAQVGVLVYGFRNFKADVEKKPEYKDDYYFGLIYVKAAEDIENRPDGEDIKRDILHKMEDPSTEENKIALTLADLALKAQLETLWRLNIFYNLVIWERDIVASGLFTNALKLMQEMNPQSCFKVESGPDKDCIVLDMSSFGKKYMQNKKPYKILMRSNGVSTYTGKDVAYQIWKFGEAEGYFKYRKYLDQPNEEILYSTYVEENSKDGDSVDITFGHADRVINVIGFEQKYPQQVVRTSLKILGFEKHYENSYHLSLKHVSLPGKKFSGRKGTWIGFDADTAIEKAIAKALEIVAEQNPELSSEYQEELASIIGIGSIKFYLAKFDLEKGITINWDDLLNFEGDSCPYVQYSCVRAKSIMNTAIERNITVPGEIDKLKPSKLSLPEERNLYFSLAKFPSKIEELSRVLNVNQIPQYALEIADKFNKFYHVCPVLGKDVEEELREARMILVQDTIKVLTIVMEDLMGIQIPEKM